jgi:hypothetical protein
MSINAVHSLFQTIMTDKGKGRNTTLLAGEIGGLEKKRARLDEEIAKKKEDLRRAGEKEGTTGRGDRQEEGGSGRAEQLRRAAQAVRDRMKNADRTHDDPMDLVVPISELRLAAKK